jgi:hypothetical protein
LGHVRALSPGLSDALSLDAGVGLALADHGTSVVEVFCMRRVSVELVLTG